MLIIGYVGRKQICHRTRIRNNKQRLCTAVAHCAPGRREATNSQTVTFSPCNQLPLSLCTQYSPPTPRVSAWGCYFLPPQTSTGIRPKHQRQGRCTATVTLIHVYILYAYCIHLSMVTFIIFTTGQGICRFQSVQSKTC